MSSKLNLSRPLLAAALIVGVAAGLAWLAPESGSATTQHRFLGMFMGAIVVFYANAIPKVLTTRAGLRCAPAADQAARRFAGWSLVLGGLGHMLAWMIAPIGMANAIAGMALGTGFVLATLRCAWGRSRASRA